jgi:bidirectional [NiFe] hydrogenase diaphorase subunit
MPTTAPSGKKAAGHPSGDKRFKLLEVVMKKNQFRQDALIEVLHAAQGLFGYLELDVLFFIARGLKLPPSRVYGVATFYHLFSLKPKGEHICLVCMGTACYVEGAQNLLNAVSEAAHVEAGETSADGKLSLLTARCLGVCGNAPLAVVDGDCRRFESPEALLQVVKGWLGNGPAGTS